MSYTYFWSCADCGTKNALELSKVNAAFFEYYREIGSLVVDKCCACGGGKYSTATWGRPDIDAELLSIWLKDENAYFMSQDESLLIADATTDELLAAYEQSLQLEYDKSWLLVEAMIVRVTGEVENDKQKLAQLTDWLRTNDHTWRGNSLIWNYLRKALAANI